MGLHPQIEAGQFRMLVLWAGKRASKLPNVPTLVEEGQKLISTSPYGLAGPKGMDPAVVETLHAAFRKGMQEPEHKAFLEKWDMTDEYLGPADYTKAAMHTIAEQKALVAELGLGQAR
jgi:tripartite-type tricarboxylate transporter receptor subunit TctC